MPEAKKETPKKTEKKVVEKKLEVKADVIEKEVTIDKPVQSVEVTSDKHTQSNKTDASTKQRIRIRLKAYDHKVIDQSAKQIVDNALRTGATIAGPIPLPTRRNTFTVVKSPHVYKKGREQFEMRIHKRLIDVLEPTPKTIDGLMNLSLPAGCDAEIKM